MITIIKAQKLFKKLNRRDCCTNENCECGCRENKQTKHEQQKLNYLEEKNVLLKETYLKLREEYKQRYQQV